MITIKVKKLNEKAVIPFKKYDDDFCYDCVAVSCEEIAPHVYKYGLGLAFEIVREEKHGDKRLDIDLRSRSSVWQTGMVLSSGESTIDEGYRGEVTAVFYHVLPNMPKYEVGDKIVQIKVGITEPIQFIEADELSKTARGNGSYGHTGR